MPDSAAPATPTAVRADLRNVAIVAHVDHGKTTLVDAMLRQTGAFRSNQAVVDRVMDSGDLEREKGITILAKQTTVDHAGVRLNIVDTPGHADFGGEVERVAADGRLGAAARGRGRGAAAADALRAPEGDGPPPAGRRRDQQDRPRRRPPGRGPRRRLRAVHGPRRRRAPDRVPGRLHERQGRHRDARPRPSPGTDLAAAARPARRGHAAGRRYTPDHPLQLLVTNLSANDYVGRMAVGRIWNGTIRTGQRITRRPRGGRRHGRARSSRAGRSP